LLSGLCEVGILENIIKIFSSASFERSSKDEGREKITIVGVFKHYRD
jgi:hypothetical protein